MPGPLIGTIVLAGIALATAGCQFGNSPPVAAELNLMPPGVACQGAIDHRAATALAIATQSRWEGSTASFADVEAFYDAELAARDWVKQGHEGPSAGALAQAKWAKEEDLLIVTQLDPSVPVRECGGFLTTFVVMIGFGYR